MEKKYPKTFNEFKLMLESKQKFDSSEDEFDYYYEKAQEEPIKTQIKKMLVEIFKDKDVMVDVGDYFDWSNGDIGDTNIDDLNDFITLVGYRCYANNQDILNDIDEFKRMILYGFSHNTKEEKIRNPKCRIIGEKYRNFKYNPNDEFHW